MRQTEQHSEKLLLVFELTGEPEKLDAFLEILKSYDIMEVCRTGVTALQRGDVKLLK